VRSAVRNDTAGRRGEGSVRLDAFRCRDPGTDRSHVSLTSPGSEARSHKARLEERRILKSEHNLCYAQGGKAESVESPGKLILDVICVSSVRNLFI